MEADDLKDYLFNAGVAAAAAGVLAGSAGRDSLYWAAFFAVGSVPYTFYSLNYSDRSLKLTRFYKRENNDVRFDS